MFRRKELPRYSDLTVGRRLRSPVTCGNRSAEMDVADGGSRAVDSSQEDVCPCWSLGIPIYHRCRRTSARTHMQQERATSAYFVLN